MHACRTSVLTLNLSPVMLVFTGKLVSSVKALDVAEDDLWALLKAFAAVLHLGQVVHHKSGAGFSA